MQWGRVCRCQGAHVASNVFCLVQHSQQDLGMAGITSCKDIGIEQHGSMRSLSGLGPGNCAVKQTRLTIARPATSRIHLIKFTLIDGMFIVRVNALLFRMFGWSILCQLGAFKLDFGHCLA